MKSNQPYFLGVQEGQGHCLLYPLPIDPKEDIIQLTIKYIKSAYIT